MINTKMFQSEMENLELGLNLGPSDLLFADDLLNIPLESLQQQGGFAFEDNDQWSSDIEDLKQEVKKEQQQVVDFDDDDILERIIKEVKLPRETYADGASNFWLDDHVVFPSQPSPTSSCCSSAFSEESTQTLIDEMEEFLVHHEGEKFSDDEDLMDTCEVKPSLADTRHAEQLLDALMNGNISMDDSGFVGDVSSSSINNISEITTEDGQKIVIVITNDMDQRSSTPLSSLASPVPSTSGGSSIVDSDSDWSPESPEQQKSNKRKPTSAASPTKQGKVEKKRAPYKRSAHANVKDKKERKKLQNVVAARRYRDKKKSEQCTVESEEQELADRNRELRDKLGEMESEVKTLKKLMLELGLVKLASKM